MIFAKPDGHVLCMDIYVPQTVKPAPVVIWIFGGSWKFGSKGYHVNLRNLTQYGIAVAAIQYRLSGTAKYPAQLDDCRAAIAWLCENGSKYGLDSTRIGVSGESAGGHLAALVGIVEGKNHIRGVCALYPPTDIIKLTRLYNKQYQPTDMERMLGGYLKDKMALAADASPINHVNSSSPPFLIFHGKDDQLVPVAQSEELAKRLRRAGVPVRLVIVPKKGHWFLLNKAQLAETAAFFQKSFAGRP
ncbi:MAG: alpha/beta hydrolase [Chthoniobacterales bacterium]